MTVDAITTTIRLAVCTGPRCGRRGRALARVAPRYSACTVFKTECLFLCSRSPVLIVYPGGVWYGQITPNNLAMLLSGDEAGVLVDHRVESAHIASDASTAPVSRPSPIIE